jgi:hypothetical protein
MPTISWFWSAIFEWVIISLGDEHHARTHTHTHTRYMLFITLGPSPRPVSQPIIESTDPRNRTAPARLSSSRSAPHATTEPICSTHLTEPTRPRSSRPTPRVPILTWLRHFSLSLSHSTISSPILLQWTQPFYFTELNHFSTMNLVILLE